MKTLYIILGFVGVIFISAAIAESYTNLEVVTYNNDTGKLCVPTQTSSCPDVAWTQVSCRKSNWGYIQGDGDQSCQATVTFASAYCSIPDVVVNCAGYKANSVPANRGDSAGTVAAWASAQMLQTNQFIVVIMASQNIATNVYAIYTWTAKPQGDD